MGKGVVITEAGQGAPFRQLPSNEGEMIGVLEPNTELELNSYDNGWYAATADGVEGYVSAKFVQALDGIEGLDGKKVKAAKAVVKTVKAAKRSVGKKTPKAKAANDKVTDKVGKSGKIATVANSAASVAKSKLSKAEKAKIYEANKVVSIERTDKGLSITLEGTEGFDGFDGVDDDVVLNGVMGKIKTAVSRAAKNYKPEVTKVTSRGVYEANKIITIRRTDTGFQVGIQGINGFDGIDGLDDEETLNGLLKNIASKVKTAAQKVTTAVKNTVSKVKSGADNVAATASSVSNAATQAQQTAAEVKSAAAQALTAAANAKAANSNSNTQNQTTMDVSAAMPEQQAADNGKKKKILLYGGIGLGAIILGVVGYKLLKKKTVSAPAEKLSGVGRRKRRKSAVKKIDLF